MRWTVLLLLVLACQRPADEEHGAASPAPAVPGMETVLVPASAGVLSALGLVAAEERVDAVHSYLLPLAEAEELPNEGEADLRYAGQSLELTIPLGPGLADRFHSAHEERYGYADPTQPLELVAVRTAELRAAPEVRVSGPRRVARDGRRAGRATRRRTRLRHGRCVGARSARPTG